MLISLDFADSNGRIRFANNVRLAAMNIAFSWSDDFPLGNPQSDRTVSTVT